MNRILLSGALGLGLAACAHMPASPETTSGTADDLMAEVEKLPDILRCEDLREAMAPIFLKNGFRERLAAKCGINITFRGQTDYVNLVIDGDCLEGEAVARDEHVVELSSATKRLVGTCVGPIFGREGDWRDLGKE